MSGGVASDGLAGKPGSYHGRPARRIETAHCWIEVLTEAGPRVVGFGLPGEAGILTDSTDASWDAGYGTYELFGGHRIWFAPERAECSVPDSTGLTVAAVEGAEGPAIRLTGTVEPPTGLRKTLEVRMDPASSTVRLRHTFTNEGTAEIELAPWPVTQLRLGGVATIPLPGIVPAHSMRPSQSLALWPYSSWADDRLTIGPRSLTVVGRPDKPFKIGCLSLIGELSYDLDGVRFTKRFDPAPDALHADMGCNAEIYTDEGTIELESLGPLVKLGPGQSTTHDETWEIRRVG